MQSSNNNIYDDFKVRKQRFKSKTQLTWKSISNKPRTIFDKHEDTEPKWYVLKINYTREKSIIQQIQKLVNSNVILEYKKASELSKAVIRYKLLFIKMILNHRNINASRKVQYTYGFYLSNKNIITIGNISDYKQKAVNEKTQTEQNNVKQERVNNNSVDMLVKGQYVTINKGFFAGSKGKIVSINNNVVSVEVDFYYNTTITTELDISSIALN